VKQDAAKQDQLRKQEQAKAEAQSKQEAAKKAEEGVRVAGVSGGRVSVIDKKRFFFSCLFSFFTFLTVRAPRVCSPRCPKAV
jgi:hypothetical protein